MKINTGVDIIEVERIEKSINERGQEFINRIFTQEEQNYCEKRKKNKVQCYAARFAAKEATFKAISTLLTDKYSISWKNIQIINNKLGKPELQFICLSKEVEKELKVIQCIDVSLSHIKEYAIASITLIRN